MARTETVGVLIAEDDALINAGTASQLRRLGYAVGMRCLGRPMTDRRRWRWCARTILPWF